MENGTLTDFEQNAKTVIRFLQDNLEKIKELHKDLTRQYTQSIIQRANNIAFEIIQSFNTFDKAYSQILRWYLRNRMPEYERRIKDGWSQIQKKAKKIVFLSQTEHRFSEYSGKAYLEVGKLMWYMEHLRDDLLYCVKDDKKQLVDEQSRERETKEPSETCKIAWESYEWVTKERPDLVPDESKKSKQLKITKWYSLAMYDHIKENGPFYENHPDYPRPMPGYGSWTRYLRKYIKCKEATEEEQPTISDQPKSSVRRGDVQDGDLRRISSRFDPDNPA